MHWSRRADRWNRTLVSNHDFHEQLQRAAVKRCTLLIRQTKKNGASAYAAGDFFLLDFCLEQKSVKQKKDPRPARTPQAFFCVFVDEMRFWSKTYFS